MRAPRQPPDRTANAERAKRDETRRTTTATWSQSSPSKFSTNHFGSCAAMTCVMSRPLWNTSQTESANGRTRQRARRRSPQPEASMTLQLNIVRWVSEKNTYSLRASLATIRWFCATISCLRRARSAGVPAGRPRGKEHELKGTDTKSEHLMRRTDVQATMRMAER